MNTKTTFDLPEALVIAAKKRAAELKKPLRALVEEGLRKVLRLEKTSQHKAKKISWVTANGGLPEDLDISDREKMHTWLKKHS